MKKTKLPPPPSPRVSFISVSRLFNLGNYENVKYEIGVEVPPGADADKTLRRLSTILYRLRPIMIPKPAMQENESILKKPARTRTDYEKGALKRNREKIAQYHEEKKLRDLAVAQLNNLGGSVTKKDAKETWEDSEEIW